MAPWSTEVKAAPRAPSRDLSAISTRLVISTVVISAAAMGATRKPLKLAVPRLCTSSAGNSR